MDFVARGCAGRVEIEAVAGEPFGVGRITFALPQNALPEPLGLEGIGISEKNDRVLYPASDSQALRNALRDALDGDNPLTSGGPVRQEVGGLLRGLLERPPRTTMYFLFRGVEPLQLSLEAKQRIPFNIVVPRQDPLAHRRLLDVWWRQYAKPAGLLEAKPDYPPLVDTYVTTTLARRLNVRLPDKKQLTPADVSLRSELGLNLGSESLRMAMMQDRILGLNNLDQAADQPLPEALSSPPLEVPEPAADVAVEPIAMRVPVECFYAHFGSFTNFLWLQDTLEKWGGDMQNLVALRGLDHGMRNRIERQLVLKQTLLSRMLGETVIADVAFIGSDMFFREGASYGLLFHARNNFVLSTNLNQQRQERVKAGGVKEEKVTIAGHEVSYLSSSDGSVRSYYVVDGDFHFTTTSRHLVERFLETASGKDALGSSLEFRHARSIMPISRDDTVWFYVSDAFFRNITSPHYRIEMARRLQAVSDIELVQLAKLAAATEARPGATIEQLKESALLPLEFGPLPDGSHTVLSGGEVYDSLRGRRGGFVPVSDVPVEKVTHAEAAEYQKFADFYAAKWGRMDPVIVALKRTPVEGDREQVTIDAQMCPLAPQHFALLNQRLGPADQQQLTPIPGDMAAAEVILEGQRVFAGLRDVGRPPTAGMASLLPIGRLRDFLVGYIGTTGDLGVLGVLNLGIPPQSDAAGYAMSPLGGWRRQIDGFTVFSFQREVLDFVAPQLRFQPADARRSCGCGSTMFRMPRSHPP